MSGSVADAIRDLHARYTDAVWRKDYAAFGECFTPDAEWRIGGLELRGRLQITETFEKIMGNFRKVLITFQSPILETAAGKASGRTYVSEQVSRADGTANISIGRYYERFAQEEGRWRFAWRLFQLHYSGPPDLSGRFFDWDDYGAPPGMPPLDAPSGDFAAAKWNIRANPGREASPFVKGPEKTLDIRKDHVFDTVSLEQTLYQYCNELDSGAKRIEDYFSEDCIFVVGETTWKGRAGVRQHYDDDAKAVQTLCEGGVKTVRHGMLNLRIQVQDDGSAIANLIFLNFSAGGKGPFLNAASPAVVADTRMTCRRDGKGRWLIHEFHGTPLFFGNDPYMNTVLRKM